MTWNWQRLDWPNFTWDAALLRQAEEHFLLGSGMFAGILKHLNELDQEQLKIEAISMEAITTSEIEARSLTASAYSRPFAGNSVWRRTTGG
jgi:Fic family protein